MTRKRSTYRPRPISAPMLVNRGIQENAIDTRELMMVQAFSGGWATTHHFDNLADMRNALTLAAAHKDDESALAMCEAMRVIFANLRERHARTGRFGLTGDELQLLRQFVDLYRDFWLRQPVSLYEWACDEIGKHNLSNQEKAA